jgi:prevent-host-death family protein
MLASDQYSGHMARKLTATEVKAKILAVLHEVEDGEEFEITRHGRTIARLTPARSSRVPWGKHVGIAWTTDPNDDLYTASEDWETS